jgi:hypothetical protein
MSFAMPALWSGFVAAGGLVSYGPRLNPPDLLASAIVPPKKRPKAEIIVVSTSTGA